MKAIIIASVGESHPLYNIPFEATIIPCNNKLQVRAIGVGRYFIPEGSNGISNFNCQEIGGVSPSSVRIKTFNGYAKKIFLENEGKWIDAEEYSEYKLYLRLKKKYETK